MGIKGGGQRGRPSKAALHAAESKLRGSAAFMKTWAGIESTSTSSETSVSNPIVQDLSRTTSLAEELPSTEEIGTDSYVPLSDVMATCCNPEPFEQVEATWSSVVVSTDSTTRQAVEADINPENSEHSTCSSAATRANDEECCNLLPAPSMPPMACEPVEGHPESGRMGVLRMTVTDAVNASHYEDSCSFSIYVSVLVPKFKGWKVMRHTTTFRSYATSPNERRDEAGAEAQRLAWGLLRPHLSTHVLEEMLSLARLVPLAVCGDGNCGYYSVLASGPLGLQHCKPGRIRSPTPADYNAQQCLREACVKWLQQDSQLEIRKAFRSTEGVQPINSVEAIVAQLRGKTNAKEPMGVYANSLSLRAMANCEACNIVVINTSELFDRVCIYNPHKEVQIFRLWQMKLLPSY